MVTRWIRAGIIGISMCWSAIGMAQGADSESSDSQITLVASYAEIPVVVDGVLDDPVWEKAEIYALALGADKPGNLQEQGQVQVAWDDAYLYVGVRFFDSDIVAEGEGNQLHHYLMGDVLEVFLKPDGYTWYWELYATPREFKTTFFYPGRGRRGLDSVADFPMKGLRVAARYRGTLNDWTDRDEEWSAEMAIPIAELTARGEPFGPEASWRILIGRMNYSRYLPQYEISMYPRLSRTNFHRYEDYARLRLVR